MPVPVNPHRAAWYANLHAQVKDSLENQDLSRWRSLAGVIHRTAQDTGIARSLVNLHIRAMAEHHEDGLDFRANGGLVQVRPDPGSCP